MRLVLASASLRRAELLAQIGIQPDEVRHPDIDESVFRNELPRPYCRRMAASKAKAIPVKKGEIVLAADTVVALGRRILGKPADEAEACVFLRKLSGRRHRVITAVAVRTSKRAWLRDAVTIVKMRRLSEAELESYIKSAEWRGKAGAYGIQGKAGAFVPWIRGSFTAVVGLPLTETAGMLRAAGFRIQSEN